MVLVEIAAGVATAVAAGVIGYEIKLWRDRRRERPARNDDLGRDLEAFCNLWDRLKGANTPGIKLRNTLIGDAIQISRRAGHRYVRPLHGKLIGNKFDRFLREAQKFPKTDDMTWSKGVMTEVDSICRQLRTIAASLRT